MFTEVVLPDANREELTSLHVVIFLGPRKTIWQFPLSIDLNLEKHRDGRWWGPIASPEQFAQVFNRQIAEYREMGRRMRGETAK
jgi:hypothetical protein